MSQNLLSPPYQLNEQSRIWHRPDFDSISYSDGDAAEERIAVIVRQAGDVSVLSAELAAKCTDWPSLYHLSRSRANILRPFHKILKNADVLEIGAGCGAITRYLGEAGANVLALESSMRRATIAQSRCRDMKNVTVLAEKFEHYESTSHFDIVTLIGVLEYAAVFSQGANPPLALLNRARSLLKPDGLLIIAIENKLGLKYFAGAPEDNVGKPMYSIEDRYKDAEPRTYGKSELDRLLIEAGFAKTDFMAPFPDYKLPVSVLTRTGMENGDFDASAFAWQSVRRDPQLPPNCVFSPELTWSGVFANKLGMELSNSFLIASSPSASATPPFDQRLLAWHYSTDRNAQYCRETCFMCAEDGSITVHYSPLSSSDVAEPPRDSPRLRFISPELVPYVKGVPLAMIFIRLITRDGWRMAEAGKLLRDYLSMIITLAGITADIEDLLTRRKTLPGTLFDATLQNILVRADGRPALIDEEWQLDATLDAGYLVFRSLLRIAACVTRFGRCADDTSMTEKSFVLGIMRAAGLRFEDQDIEHFRTLEVVIQQHLTGSDASCFSAGWEKRSLPMANLLQNMQELDHRIRELEGKLTHCESLLGEAEVRFTAINTSASWRMTVPLRWSSRICLRFCRACPGGKWVLRIINQLISGMFGVWQRINFGLQTRQAKVSSGLQRTGNLLALDALSARRISENALRTASPVVVPQVWPDIDLTVVSYNSSRWIDLFFTSLRQQNYPLDRIHLWIVDHESHDDTLKMLEKWREQVGKSFACFQIITQSNKGFGAGHDRAIREGRAPYCLVSNLDVEFTQDGLCKLVLLALADLESMVASWEMRQAPFEHPKYYDPVTLETNWSSHSCILIRRTAYQKVGGYDPGIFMYGEDVELSYRFRSFGYVLKYVPNAVVIHHAYSMADEIKPLQYAGSVLGNMMIRLRYGSLNDCMMGLLFYASRLASPGPFHGARALLWRQSFKPLPRLAHFLHGKGPADVHFPFRGADYELTRNGAFHRAMPTCDPSVKPRVSIITRTYAGRSVFLAQAVQSVFHQTYPEIELLVVEDGGSTLAENVKHLASHAPAGCRVHYLSRPKQGRSATGNAGLLASTGDLLMFLDDDDLLFADHVETLVSALSDNPDAAAAYALSLEVRTDLDMSALGYRERSFQTPRIFFQEWDFAVLRHHNFLTIQSLLFKRELYLKRGGFDATLDQLEDWNLWLRYGYGQRFVYVPKTTSLYRVPTGVKTQYARHARMHEFYKQASIRAFTCPRGMS